MGLGCGYAIAAALIEQRRPEGQRSPVVAIQGDSAFGFSGMEVETASRCGWGVVDRNQSGLTHKLLICPSLELEIILKCVSGQGEIHVFHLNIYTLHIFVTFGQFCPDYFPHLCTLWFSTLQLFSFSSSQHDYTLQYWYMHTHWSLISPDTSFPLSFWWWTTVESIAEWTLTRGMKSCKNQTCHWGVNM